MCHFAHPLNNLGSGVQEQFFWSGLYVSDGWPVSRKVNGFEGGCLVSREVNGFEEGLQRFSLLEVWDSYTATPLFLHYFGTYFGSFYACYL